MYLSSKLIGIATAILSSGTITSVTIPCFNNLNWTDWLYKKDDSLKQYDFKVLDKETESRLVELQKRLERFLSAEDAAKFLKSKTFTNIQTLFQNISQSEEKLKELFEKITRSFNQLLEKSQATFKATEQKLEEEKQKQLQKTIGENYSALQKALAEWKNHLSAISCAIENKEGGSNCKAERKEVSSLFDSFLSFASLLIKTSPPESTAGSSLTGSEKAKQDLKEIQDSLLKIIGEIQRKSGIYNVGQSYAKSKEAIAILKHTYQSELLKILSSEIKKLNQSVKQDNEQTKQISEEINQFNSKLKSSYSYYEQLKKQEQFFHSWKEIFVKEVLKNKSDLSKEVQISLSNS